MNIPNYLKYVTENLSTLNDVDKLLLQENVELFINDEINIHDLSEVIEEIGLLNINNFEKSNTFNHISN